VDYNNLQDDVLELSNWSRYWLMNFNASKCKVMNISRKVNKVERSHELESVVLDCVNQIPDLGLTLTNTLSWNKHIEDIALKTNRKLGLIRRLTKENRDVGVRKLLYRSIVRPSLEYSSQVWSPYITQSKIKCCWRIFNDGRLSIS
jgi:hypothetical protein